ncbi:hypothetical protein VZC37_07590 [Gordonia sp. LSe1-13]|uniref:Uncharacterized protein n=1 Tax=Gordonia sesuvii TaxID=3116777 RepID=A0ABU7MB16_9ACTN|nr:hypothetical protein [Gordonia sp. LSe1-13]
MFSAVMSQVISTLRTPLRVTTMVVVLAIVTLVVSPAPVGRSEPAAVDRFLVTAATASMGISVQRVSDDGTLIRVPGSPFPTGFGVLSLTVSADGSTVFVPRALEPAVSGYRLDRSGRLHKIPGAYQRFSGPPTAAQLTPDGTHLFVVVGGVPGHVESFAVSPSGELRPTGAPHVPVDGLSAIGQAAIDPDGRFLRVLTYVGNTMSSYAIGANGQLTPHGVSTVGAGPVAPAFSPDGRFLYTSDELSFSVSGFEVSDDGSLTRTAGSPYPTGGIPHGAIVTPDGQRLYVPNAIGVGTSVAGFRIHRDGRLSPLPHSPYPMPLGSLPGQIALHPDGKHMYVVDVATVRSTSSQVHTYVINADGSLRPSGAAPVDTGLLITDGPAVALTTLGGR